MYKKPAIKTYSAEDILEKLGPCQNQYGAAHSTTLSPGTGNSSRNVDGIVSNEASVTTGGNLLIGEMEGVGEEIEIGRSFIGFNINTLTGHVIVSATLRIYQYQVGGTPYTELGNVIVDHVDFGASLDSSDYSAAALHSNIGTISDNATIEWKTLSITSHVQGDLDAGRTSSQYRLRFTNDTGAVAPSDDYALFESSENPGGSGNFPQLVVTYN